MGMWNASDVIADGNTAGGYVGDTATGQGFIVEFTRPDVPTARATMWFAVVEDEAGADFPFAVEDGTEYLIGRDPEDLPGTEEWSETERGEGSYMAFTTAEEAVSEARRMAVRARAVIIDYDALTWDGRTTSIRERIEEARQRAIVEAIVMPEETGRQHVRDAVDRARTWHPAVSHEGGIDFPPQTFPV